MRCKRTKRPLPAIWKHPDLDGQLVSNFTRKEARFLVMAITGKDLDEAGFVRTGDFAWRQRIISTPDALREVLVRLDDMEAFE
jgi:hypothetical protein